MNIQSMLNRRSGIRDDVVVIRSGIRDVLVIQADIPADERSRTRDDVRVIQGHLPVDRRSGIRDDVVIIRPR
jgi:hypothetical protein